MFRRTSRTFLPRRRVAADVACSGSMSGMISRIWMGVCEMGSMEVDLEEAVYPVILPF